MRGVTVRSLAAVLALLAISFAFVVSASAAFPERNAHADAMAVAGEDAAGPAPVLLQEHEHLKPTPGQIAARVAKQRAAAKKRAESAMKAKRAGLAKRRAAAQKQAAAVKRRAAMKPPAKKAKKKVPERKMPGNPKPLRDPKRPPAVVPPKGKKRSALNAPRKPGGKQAPPSKTASSKAAPAKGKNVSAPTSTKSPKNTAAKKPTGKYPGATAAKKPTGKYPGATAAKKPTGKYPAATKKTTKKAAPSQKQTKTAPTKTAPTKKPPTKKPPTKKPPTKKAATKKKGTKVKCADGTFSESGGIQGACSHHGGVQKGDDTGKALGSKPPAQEQSRDLAGAKPPQTDAATPPKGGEDDQPCCKPGEVPSARFRQLEERGLSDAEIAILIGCKKCDGTDHANTPERDWPVDPKGNCQNPDCKATGETPTTKGLGQLNKERKANDAAGIPRLPPMHDPVERTTDTTHPSASPDEETKRRQVHQQQMDDIMKGKYHTIDSGPTITRSADMVSDYNKGKSPDDQIDVSSLKKVTSSTYKAGGTGGGLTGGDLPMEAHTILGTTKSGQVVSLPNETKVKYPSINHGTMVSPSFGLPAPSSSTPATSSSPDPASSTPAPSSSTPATSSPAVPSSSAPPSSSLPPTSSIVMPPSSLPATPTATKRKAEDQDPTAGLDASAGGSGGAGAGGPSAAKKTKIDPTSGVPTLF